LRETPIPWRGHN